MDGDHNCHQDSLLLAFTAISGALLLCEVAQEGTCIYAYMESLWIYENGRC